MGVMTSNRDAVAALVWRRMPAPLKVTASGLKFVTVRGKLVALDTLSADDMFTVLARNSAVNVMLKSLEAA